MRATDIVLLAVLAISSAAFAIPHTRMWLWRWRLWLCVAFAGVVLSHLLLRELFWQLIPLDLGYLSLAFACVAVRPTQALRLRLLSLSALLLGALSLALLIVLPIFHLPRPTGPYLVGTRIVHLVDSSRVDRTFPSGHRELMVQVWYPTNSSAKPLAPYRRWKETTLLSSYDVFLKTHSHLDAPVAQRGSPFPVLLFNPAWGGERTQNTYQTEYLASYGYIVIAIDHTHNSSIVAFPDGQVVRADRIPSIDDFSHSTLGHQMSVANRELDSQTKDDLFVLNAFSAMNSDRNGLWYNALDMRRVGAFGHSFGGATAVEACFRDPRIRAALNMDGWMYGAISREVLNKPLLVMYESGWPPDPKLLARESASSSPEDRMDIWDLHNLERTLLHHGGYELTIDDAQHMNFSDRSLYSPMRSLTDSGSIDPVLAHRIINEYTLAFFNHVLNGENEPILSQAIHPYSLARFIKWGAPLSKANSAPDSTAN
jgi:dienelactone hydrolase